MAEFRDENEKLIIEVEKFPHLYDLKHPDYKDIIKKSNSWKTIAETIGCRDGGKYWPIGYIQI